MLLARFKIAGHSMIPTLKPGDSIIASSIPYLFDSPKKGDIVLVKKGNKIYIKRIKKTGESSIYLEGDNKHDSLDIGIIHKKELLGKYIIKI